jgi:hypothetical protein
MADRFPLVANSQTKQIEELSAYDNLNLQNNGIVGASTITASQFIGNLVGSATTSTFLSSGANILSGTINPNRLTGFYNIGVTTANILSNANNILSGTVPKERLNGEYDIDITGTASTANSLADAGNIIDGIIPQGRLTGVYNIDITGTAFAAVGAAQSLGVSNNVVNKVNFLTFVDRINTDTSVFVDAEKLVYNPGLNYLGIGTTVPTSRLEVVGNTKLTGTTTATNIVVNSLNASSLSGVSTIDATTRNTIEVSLGLDVLNDLTVVGLSTFENLNVSNQSNLTNLRVSGISTLSRILVSNIDATNTSITGILTANNLSIGSTQVLSSDRELKNISGIDSSTKETFRNELGLDALSDINVTGLSTFQNINVTGIASLSDVNVSGGATFQTINAATFLGSGAALSGIVTSVIAGIGITIFPSNGKGSVIIDAYKPIGKTIFVTQSGDDSNSGLTENDSKLTIKAAAEIAEPGDTIKVYPGYYAENNPIVLGRNVAVEGTELRNCQVRPLNSGEDLFHVNNAVHITDLSFVGPESTNGAAIIAFQPLSGVAEDRFFDAAKLIRMNLDYIAKETVGYLTSTEYNGGSFSMGIGTQTRCSEDLKLIFKSICHDITRGGNSKCVGAGKSYYTEGGALQHIVGVKTETIDAIRYAGEIARSIVNNSTWGGKPVGTAITVSNALYDNATGLTTITASNHTLEKGDAVTLTGLGFTCPSGPGELYYPTGSAGYTFTVKQVLNSNTFEVITGISTLPHTYTSGGTIQKKTNYQTEFTQVKDLGIAADPLTGFNDSVHSCANVVSAIHSCVGVVTTIIDQGLNVLGVGINTTYPGNAGAGSTIPNDPSFSPGVGPILQGPYIRNCTNFVPKSIGMKVDGFTAEPGDQDDVGVTGSMSVDSYTQYNQGGIGVSVTNGAYAQLVSIFTICDDIAIYTASGGQCDITNSNSSFGNYGLVSEGVGDNTTGSIYTLTGIATTDAEFGQATVEVSGVGSYRPYDGQVVYFGELYNSIQTISVVDGGSGYTSVPRVTIDAPTGPNGITAQAIPTVENGSVTSITVLTAGSQYATAPNVTIEPPIGAGTTATAVVSELFPIYYRVAEATLPSSGISTISLAQNLNNTVSAGTTAYFSRISLQLASSHSFEYVGSGNDILKAKPALGGVTITENEVVKLNGGDVIYTSTDQAGNFRIGDGVAINQATGSLTGRDFTKALFTTMTPFILALAD